MNAHLTLFLLMASLANLSAAEKSTTQGPAPASGNAPTTLRIPSSNAEVTTLPNGLTLIIEADRSAPVASVQAWVGTGSIHEDDWVGAGLSHILEHMLFKGTETRGAGEFARSVQDLGGYLNAYTSFDRTVYWIDVPSAGAATAVEILADAMMNSTLPEDEYAKEQEVIRREFAMGFDDPGRTGSQLMFRTVFSESPFRHPVIGYLDVYNKLTRDDVMDYYKERYVPNNMFFSIVGDVDAKAIREQLTEFFSEYPRGPLEPVYVARDGEQVGRRVAHEEFPTELTRLSLSWRIPPVTHDDMPALDLLGTVLGGGSSSPLYRKIREDKQLAFGIGSGSYALADGGIFAIQAVCDPDKRDAVETAALATLESLKAPGGIPEKDLEKARKSLLASQLGQLTTMRGKASDLGSNWLLTRNLNFSADYLDAINRTTVEDLQRVARTYLRADNVNVTSLNPVGSTKTKDQTDSAPKPELGIKTFTLPNGLRLIVRENHRIPLVSMVAVFQGGLLAESEKNNGVSRLLATSLVKGTTSRTAAEIAEAIESVGGDIGATSGNNSNTAEVSVLATDVPLGMELLADVIINPTFPEQEVVKERSAQIAAIKAEEDQITSVARNLLRQNLFEGHPYALRGTGTEATVSALTTDDVKAMHRAVFTAKNGVLAVFGDVNADEVYKLAKEAFADLPSGPGRITTFPSGAAVDAPRSIMENREKSQAVVMVGFPGVDLFNPDRATLEVIETASSDLGSRFFDRIREQLGLAYFVGAAQLMGPTPGMLAFYVGTDPAKVDKVRTELKSEIAKLAAEGLTDEELKRAKSKLLGAEAIRNQSDAAMAQAIALDELFGLGVENAARRPEEINAVTKDDVKRVAKQILDAQKAIDVTVMPELPATAEAPANSPAAVN
jgi:zinc protease